MHTIHTYTLFRHGKNISYKIEIKTIKTDLHVCRVGVRGGQLSIYLCSDIRWKAIPQMCPTVAEATFQTTGTRLRQSQFVFRISKSLVRRSVLKGFNSWFSRDVRKKTKIKFFSFYLYQVKVIFKHISVGLSSAR